MSKYSMEGSTLSTQQFVSIVSHDLRAPVRHLTQFSILLADSLTAQSEEQKAYLSHIKQSANKFDHMMEALSELSKIQNQDLESAHCDVEALFKQHIQELSQHHDCQIEFTFHGERQHKLCMAPIHADLLVSAIVDNAIKFRSSDKPLKLSCFVSLNGDDIDIVFKDNGMGIPENFIQNCQTIFKQYENSYNGIGMGLAFVAEIVNAYEGKIEIHSLHNQDPSGTEVKLSFPSVNRIFSL